MTIRALKYHGGARLSELTAPNPAQVSSGLENMEKHLENIRLFGLPAVVAVNKFTSDTDEEIKIVTDRCEMLGVPVEVANVWAKGGEGAEGLASELVKTIDSFEGSFKPLYAWDKPVMEKIEIIASKIYGAEAIDYAPRAKKDLQKIAKLGLEHLPVCIAKTQKSLSDNPKLLGRPKDFVVTVREIEIAAGAGFLIPITGDILRMPGLPSKPSAENIDVDDAGNIIGLF